MAKVKTSYVCSQCGYETSKWNGKCPNCGEWNTFEEVELAVRAGGAKSKPTAVRDISDKIVGIDDVDASYNEIRYATGLKELDRVLGGGLVKGSLVLLGGEPGIGKSTMLLQICQYLGQDHTILYVSGEESVRQIKLRAVNNSFYKVFEEKSVYAEKLSVTNGSSEQTSHNISSALV